MKEYLKNCKFVFGLYCLCLLQLFHSCKHEPKSIILLSEVEEMEVVPKLISDELVMHPPLQLNDFGSHLMFVTPGMEHSLLFYEKASRKCTAWGKVGNGPDDFVSALCVGKEDGKMKLFDSNLRKCVEYELDLKDSVRLKRIRACRFKADSISLLNLHVMESGLMVGYVGYGSEYMFVLLDEEMNCLKTFGNPPLSGHPDKNNLQFYGWFASYKEKLFFASQPLGYLSCFSINERGDVKKEWEILASPPLYDSQAQKWKKENRIGFYDVCANGQYVFAAYSGKELQDDRSLPQQVWVFTHEGELLKRLRYKDAYVGKMDLSDSLLFTMGDDQLMALNWKDMLN